MRPVMNLANPRSINERIESLALSRANKAEKGVTESLEDVTMVKQREPPMPSVDELSAIIDRSRPGVELVRFSQGRSKTASDVQLSKTKNPSCLKLKPPNAFLINSSHPPESSNLPSTSHIHSDIGVSLHPQNSGRTTTESYGGEWAQTLDISSQRKNQALAPEHLENMWTKGKNYKSENAKHTAKVPVGSSSLGTTSSVQQSVPYSTSIRHQNGACGNLVQKEKALAENKNAKAAGRQAGVDSIEQIMKRAIRIVPISDDLGGCALCKSMVELRNRDKISKLRTVKETETR